MRPSKPLVLRDPQVKLKLKERHLKISRGKERFVIALRHFDALYLNTRIKAPLALCVKIASFMPVYLIDARGYILARIVPEERASA